MAPGPLANALIKSLETNSSPFVTYKDFARAHGFSDKYPPAWANKGTLDSVATVLKSDPQIALDLTFLIRNKKTGFPSVIGGRPYVRHNRAQERMARNVADQIIAKFGLKATNPY